MEAFLRDNILKNIVVLIISLFFFQQLHTFMTTNTALNSNVSITGNILIATSIIAVIACFGNFAFTYEKVSPHKKAQSLFAHFTTGLFMLIIAISLFITKELFIIMLGHFFVLDLFLILVYLSCVFYDFWDLFRIQNV